MTSTSPPPTLQEAEKAFADGRFKDARTILQLASKQGDPNAAYALAVAQAYGQGADVDRAAAIKTLQAVAPALPAARRFLRVAMASGWKKGLGWSDAVADLIDGARNGSASDLREVGFLLLINGEANLAISALVEAAKAQDPAAAMALIRLRSADPSTTEITRKTLNRLAQTNHPLAGELSSVYSGEVQAPNCDPIDWTVVAKAVSEPIFNAAQSAELIPTISAKSHQAILSPAICDYVITSGLRALQPSTIVDPETGERSLDPHRKSLSATFAPHMQDLVIHAVERRMTALANMPWQQAERLVMLFYRPGEEYKPHVDYFSPDEMGGSVELTRGGQRVATSLVCLHPAASGGATLFPRFDTRWLGETGDGLTFRNIDDAGQPAPLSLHQGTVVTDGWKALLSLWIRDQNTSPS
jgi:prolyl 4-hydroxylase